VSELTRVAISTWKGRVAPLFDVARNALVLHVSGSAVVDRTRETLDPSDPLQRARRLAELGVNVLVCGAVSETLRRILESQGVEVIAFVSGSLHEVTGAYLAGELPCPSYAMPGTSAKVRGEHGTRRSRPLGGRPS
jgi:predicted Fe-Mo cluster-binding NifX family protein